MFTLNSLSIYAASTALPSTNARAYNQRPRNPSEGSRTPPILSRSSSEAVAGGVSSGDATERNDSQRHRRDPVPNPHHVPHTHQHHHHHHHHHQGLHGAHTHSNSPPSSTSTASPGGVPSPARSLHAAEVVGAAASIDRPVHGRDTSPRRHRPTSASVTAHAPPPPAPAAPTGRDKEADKRRSRNIFKTTLQALGIMGPVLGRGTLVASQSPSQRYNTSGIARRHVYGDSAPLAYTERQNSDLVQMAARDRQRRRSQGLDAGEGEEEGARRGRPHGERVRSGGLSVDVQHMVLRRLQYQRPTSIDDLALDTPYTPYTPVAPGLYLPHQSSCEEGGGEGHHEGGEASASVSLNADANPLGPLPRTRSPTSATETSSVGTYAPQTQAERDWVNSLQPAPEGALPFPEASTHCQVCLRHFRHGEDVAELPCGHLFHFYCVVRWLRTHAQCPFCRQDVLGSNSVGGREAARAPRTNSAPSPHS